MDSHNDWDLFAVVRSCNNLNVNSSTRGVRDAFNGHEQSYDHGSDFPNLLGQRRYFGLEEVIDRFINRNRTESHVDPQTNSIPPTTSRPQSCNKVDGSGDTGKDTQAAPQITILPPISKPQQPLPDLQIGSPDKSGGLRDEKVRSQVNVVEVLIEKAEEWDGWLWRKYGNKMVCNSPYSKSYYRCSYEGNKCLAKKHVQKSKKDERMNIVTYKGLHNHPPPIQNNITKRRKRNSNQTPPAEKRECPFYPPPTNNST